jgi:tetratricopeptide (TPR) repeat protein
MHCLPHPLVEASRRYRYQTSSLSGLVHLCADLRSCKIQCNRHDDAFNAREYALQTIAVGFLTLWELAVKKKLVYGECPGEVNFRGNHLPCFQSSCKGVESFSQFFLSADLEDLVQQLSQEIRLFSKATSYGNTDLVPQTLVYKSSRSNINSGVPVNESRWQAILHALDLLIEDINKYFFKLQSDFQVLSSSSFPELHNFQVWLTSVVVNFKDWRALLNSLKEEWKALKNGNPILYSSIIEVLSRPPLDETILVSANTNVRPLSNTIPSFIRDIWGFLGNDPTEMQSFYQIAQRILLDIRDDEIAHAVWEYYVESLMSRDIRDPWQIEDLGLVSIHQSLSIKEFSDIFPCDPLYCITLNDGVLWRLMGWLHLSLFEENKLYALRKQLPILGLAKPIGMIQDLMNTLRNKYGYSREIHHRLTLIMLKVANKPYPSFAPRFNVVLQLVTNMYSKLTVMVSKPYFNMLDVQLMNSLTSLVHEKLGLISSLHEVKLSIRDLRSEPHLFDLSMILSEVQQQNLSLVSRIFINPLSFSIRFHENDSSCLEWLGMTVTACPFAFPTFTSTEVNNIDLLCSILQAGNLHSAIRPIYGISHINRAWVLICPLENQMLKLSRDVDVISLLATSMSNSLDESRYAAASTMARILWLLSQVGIHFNFEQYHPLNNRNTTLYPRLTLTEGSIDHPCSTQLQFNLPDALKAGDVIDKFNWEGVVDFITFILQPSELRSRILSSATSHPGGYSQIYKKIQNIKDELQNPSIDEFYGLLCDKLRPAFVPSQTFRNSKLMLDLNSQVKQSNFVEQSLNSHLHEIEGSIEKISMSPAKVISPISSERENENEILNIAAPSWEVAAPQLSHPQEVYSSQEAKDFNITRAPSNGDITSDNRRSPLHSGSCTPSDSNRNSMSSYNVIKYTSHSPTDTLRSQSVSRNASLTQDEAQIAESWNRALLFYGDGLEDVAAAFILFNEVKSHFPPALYYMAESLYFGSRMGRMRQDPLAASEYYREALQCNVDAAHVGMGDCAFFSFDAQSKFETDNERLARAQEHYELAVNLLFREICHPPIHSKYRARAVCGLGDVLFAKQEYEQALDYYAIAIRLDPGPVPCSPTYVPAVANHLASLLEGQILLETKTPGAGCRRAYAQLAELAILKVLPESHVPEYLKRARGCRREVLAKCRWFRSQELESAASEYENEYLWRYPLEF